MSHWLERELRAVVRNPEYSRELRFSAYRAIVRYTASADQWRRACERTERLNAETSANNALLFERAYMQRPQAPQPVLHAASKRTASGNS